MEHILLTLPKGVKVFLTFKFWKHGSFQTVIDANLYCTICRLSYNSWGQPAKNIDYLT